MEDLIPVLIFIAIVLGSFIKKIIAKQNPQQKTTAGGNGWVAKLNTYLDDLKNRIEEQQPREESASADQWRQLMGKDAPSRGGRMAMNALSDADVDDLSDLSPVTPAMPGANALPGAVSEPLPAPGRHLPGLGRKQHPKARLGRAQGVVGLRKAIVWAEIIGPPVGLRPPGEDRF